MTPLDLAVGDVLRLRRRHPCGTDSWVVVRLGADIGVRCQGCQRRVLLERRVLEKRLAGFISQVERSASDQAPR